MKRLTMMLSGIAMLAFGAAACGGDSGTDSFDSWVSSQKSVIAKICSCAADPTMCESDFGLTSTEESCIRGVIANNDSTALQDALGCQETANNTYHACINPITCDDMTTAQDDCDAAFDTEFDACPEIPAAVDAAVESMCFPE